MNDFFYVLLASFPVGFGVGFLAARSLRLTLAIPGGLIGGVGWFILCVGLTSRGISNSCTDCNPDGWAVLILAPINAVVYLVGMVTGLIVGRVAPPASTPAAD
jgi:hypothetical protein